MNREEILLEIEKYKNLLKESDNDECRQSEYYECFTKLWEEKIINLNYMLYNLN